ncbi:hypothetical protein U9M48_018193 [Paspalum notatum var. saurae]|uniref:KIB1-4 beta-propeller domain-containing protein n=1 Tax=Paspalum notatum var. saurae TaxID=547442 RepID=A0AAQ3WPI2_PASNO
MLVSQFPPETLTIHCNNPWPWSCSGQTRHGRSSASSSTASRRWPTASASAPSAGRGTRPSGSSRGAAGSSRGWRSPSPRPRQPASDRASFDSLSDRAVYRLPFPTGGGVSAALADSANDWLVVAHRDRGNFLLDPFTGATLPLPHQRTITRSAYRLGRGDDHLVEYYPPRSQREPYILKAVLSRRPSADDPAGRCIVAAIVDSGELFFCRPGDSSWRRPGTFDSKGIYSDCFHDITFCNGRLYGITKRDPLTFGFEYVSVFDVDEDAGELVESRTGGYSLDKYPGPDDSDESEEERRYRYCHRPPQATAAVLRRVARPAAHGRALLLVLRQRRSAHLPVQGVPPRTSPVQEAAQHRPVRSMGEAPSLDGEVLFLGGSGPRSFAAAEHGVDADCIYFADDHHQEGDKNVYYARSRDDDWPADDPTETQPCGDIGRYCMRDKSVTLLTKELPANERRSPPVWLYLSDQRR